uniref:Redoxin domain protein n=1 Tax=Sphingobacterium sp. (strain 21) TaxID=743722 RepID=F4C8V6_SPHS2
MKLFTSYIRELFVQFKLKNSIAVTRERSLMMSGARRFIIPFCNGVMQGVEPLSTTDCIQKINEKTTCNSRVTGKWGLRRFKGVFWWFFIAKICIKKYWKFRCRYLFSSQNGAYETIRIGRRMRVLKPYTVYLITLKILFCVCLAHARQSSSPEAAHGVALITDSIKPLQIGDTIPEALWHMPLQMVKAGQEGSTTVTLNDYRGKLIILDFWSTWCSACIAAMPKLLHLQQTFYQSIQVLPVSFQTTQKVREGYDHNKILKSIPMFSIVEDQSLQQAFPHQILPHVVWITPDGKFGAATSSDLLTSTYIQEALNGKLYRWPVKEELRQLYDLPLLVSNENLSTSKANCYYSVLTPYQKGINNYHVKQLADTVSGTVRWQFINHSIRSLYLKALGRFNDFPRNRIICEGISPDTVLFDAHQAGLNRDAWYQKHAVSYETQLPLQTSFSAVKAKLLSDLNSYLALNVRLEQRVMPCFRLVLTDAKRLREAAEDAEYSNTLLDKIAPIKKLIAAPPSRLVASLNQMANIPPILDGTDFKGKLDLTLHLDDVSDINKLNEQLMRYGLLLQACEERIEVLVISKN